MPISCLSPLLTLTLNQGPFPPPALPGFPGTTGLSATPHGPACPSRASGWARAALRPGLPVLLRNSVYENAVTNTPVSPPGAPIALLPRRRRPSPKDTRVGALITLFEACSAFTHVTACLLAESPCDPLLRGLRRLRYLHRRLDCYRLERSVAGWVSHPLKLRAFPRRAVSVGLTIGRRLPRRVCRRYLHGAGPWRYAP